MKRSWKVMILLVLSLTLLLSACKTKAPEVDKPVVDGSETEGNGDTEEVEEKIEINLPHPKVIKKDGELVGGTLNMALVTDAPFEGIFNTFLYSNQADRTLMAPTIGSFTRSGPNYEIGVGGYAELEFDKDSKTATYKIQEGLTWSDGVPVTSDRKSVV